MVRWVHVSEGWRALDGGKGVSCGRGASIHTYAPYILRHDTKAFVQL